MRNQDYLSNYDGLVWHVMGAKNTMELCYNFNTQINSNQIIQNIVEYQVQNDQYVNWFRLRYEICNVFIISLFDSISYYVTIIIKLLTKIFFVAMWNSETEQGNVSHFFFWYVAYRVLVSNKLFVFFLFLASCLSFLCVQSRK